MQRIVILTLAIVAVLLVVVQLALPPLLEGHAEGRLTKQGGHADVELSAFPSPRLLFKEGDRLKVRASGIQAPLPDPGSSSTLGDLDGFGSVDVQVTDMRIGPFDVARLTLRRDGDGPYRSALRATITAADFSTFAGATLGGGLGAFLGGLAGGAMPRGQAPIPIDVDAVLRSDGGRVRTVSVNGSVAGLPAGPLVEVLAAALAGRF
jgi:hypothetical protein